MKCLGEKCPNNCCSNKFIGLSASLKNINSDKFVQIKLDDNEVERIKNIGRCDLIENKNNEMYLKLNNDNSCKAFINGKCSIYNVRPDVCKLYPYYFDPFCGVCIDKNCPGSFELECNDEIYHLILNRLELFCNFQKANHYFFDGYGIPNKELKDTKKIKELLEKLRQVFLKNQDVKMQIIPYFHCQNKEMGGVSAVLLGSDFHFTCHTFSSKETLFIDCYGKNIDSLRLTNIIKEYYSVDNYDLCVEQEENTGKFGKHLIINGKTHINYKEARNLINKIVKKIKMTPISKLIDFYKNDYEYDLLQPIAESHISIHSQNDNISIDIFSCKNFEETEILKILDFKNIDFKIISRGKYFS